MLSQRNLSCHRMLPLVFSTAVAVLLGRAPLTAQETCGEFGTAVQFAESVPEAAQQARQQEKLVFVLHVSGHFEQSEYT